uniref:Programmed cell death protein 4 n=1 Tax=Suberites domuncula TaxID=55567 RepID=O96944_SUBDO|nr:MA3 [Suberites domuncula]
MSSMEVEPQQVNGFGGSKNSPTNGHHVQFDTTVKVVTMPATSTQPSSRPKHKARRRARVPANLDIGEDETSSVSSTTKPPSPSKLKKMADKERRSRSGRRGQPKKGGGGGKGTWGNITDEMYAEPVTHDTHDPNYDSVDEDDATYLVSPSSSQMSALDFEKTAIEIFKEYFDHGDTQEVASSLEELSIKNIKHEVVRIVVTLALEEKAANREKVSVLLSDLYGQVINGREVAKGFDIILSQLNDLILDTPDAASVIGNFIARCVADDCLPPAFVSNHTDVTNEQIIVALKRAQLLLSIKHSIARLDNVWGVGGGQRPVMFLISKMNLLLKEYLSSGDCEEATRCLRDLEVPHFHHELVHEALVLVMEDATDHTAKMIASLLQHMGQTGVISTDQFNSGIMRVFSDMTDIVLDIPNAYHTLSKFVERGAAAGFVSRQIAEEIPSRGRKRYVSEGDGGAIKSPED